MKNVTQVFEEIIGQMAWSIRRTHGSCFFIEFGLPHIETIGPLRSDKTMSEDRAFLRQCRRVFLHGEWSLMVLDCNWNFDAWNYSANQDVDPSSMEKPFEGGAGQYLESVSYGIEKKSCVFSFDLGAKLMTAPKDAALPLEEQWTLRDRQGVYISLLNNGDISIKKGGEA